MKKTDRKEEELALFDQFQRALGNSELSSGRARAGQVDCRVPGDTNQLNEPDVVCSMPSGSVRYFENVQLVPEELMELIHRPFLDYHDLLGDSDILLLETRYQGCYLAYDEPGDGRLCRAVIRVLRYLLHGEPAADFTTTDSQVIIPYEAVGDNGQVVQTLLGESWRLAPCEIPQYPGVTVAQLVPHGPPQLVPSARSAKDPAMSRLGQKCKKTYIDSTSALRICPELVLWSAGDSGFALEKSADALNSPTARDKWESHFIALWLFDVSTGQILHLEGQPRPPEEDTESET